MILRIWVNCKCGCGQRIETPDARGVEREYITGHRPAERKLAPEQQVRLAEMYRAGESYESIAEQLNIEPRLVVFWRKRLGLPKRSAPRAKQARKAQPGVVGKCVYCGAEATCWDHIVPLARGGLDVPSNRVASCRSCNSSKGTKSVAVFTSDRGWAWRERARLASESSSPPPPATR